MCPSGGTASGRMNNLSVPPVYVVKKLPCHNFFSSLFTSALMLPVCVDFLHYGIRSNSLFKAIRHRETKSQTDRQTDRRTDRDSDRQAGRDVGRQALRQAVRQADRQTERQAGWLAGRQTDGRTGRQTDGRTCQGR